MKMIELLAKIETLDNRFDLLIAQLKKMKLI